MRGAVTTAEPAFVRRQPGLSGWALAAVLLAVAVMCPPLPLIGALLGLKALHHVNAVPGRRGRGLALTAITVGLAATIAWTAAAIWWDRSVRQPIRRGPDAALAAGLAGDVAGFQAGFATGPVDAGAADAFLQELERRYGSYVGLSPADAAVRVPPADADPEPVMRGGRVTCPYELHFARQQRVPALATFQVFAPGDGLVRRFTALEILDPPRPPLRYPPSDAAPASASTP